LYHAAEVRSKTNLDLHNKELLYVLICHVILAQEDASFENLHVIPDLHYMGTEFHDSQLVMRIFNRNYSSEGKIFLQYSLKSVHLVTLICQQYYKK
jgi:hypothetical protein